MNASPFFQKKISIVENYSKCFANILLFHANYFSKRRQSIFIAYIDNCLTISNENMNVRRWMVLSVYHHLEAILSENRWHCAQILIQPDSFVIYPHVVSSPMLQ